MDIFLRLYHGPLIQKDRSIKEYRSIFWHARLKRVRFFKCLAY